MPALLAAAPLALIIALMLGLRWPAARAGLAGLAVALGVAYLGFGYGDAVLGEIGPARAGAFAFAEAGFTAATILWIIFPALCVYEIQKRSGAFDVIRAGLASVSTDRRVQVLLIAWFFALFMEGAAGFGTPVALAAALAGEPWIHAAQGGDAGADRPCGGGVLRGGGDADRRAGQSHRHLRAGDRAMDRADASSRRRRARGAADARRR